MLYQLHGERHVVLIPSSFSPYLALWFFIALSTNWQNILDLSVCISFVRLGTMFCL